MKLRLILTGVATMAILASCGNSTQQNGNDNTDRTVGSEVSANNGAMGKIEYVETEFDFGTIKEGNIIDHVFKFKNTGDAPVILSQVSASCGCTTPDYTKEPVLPGQEGEIRVSFNSQGQVGRQQKIVTISSNAENRVSTVQIKGTVEK
ncbi:MAG TPA: DUF1573 domain-containing protein [Sphingobacterium sp.]|nr:DUF1573 domain-containing protein [Sphingobacterium sp.]